MPRPRGLDLRLAGGGWRRVPMPGANLDLDVIPLESDGDRFTILARFPAGFRRDVPGGYLAAEEFLVLDGRLEFEGVGYGRGALTFVPGSYLRTSMHAPQQCTALAWFSSEARFRAADDLAPVSTEAIRSVNAFTAATGGALTTTEAIWRITDGAGWPEGAEAVALDGSAWAREPCAWPAGVPVTGLLVREPTPDD